MKINHLAFAPFFALAIACGGGSTPEPETPAGEAAEEKAESPEEEAAETPEQEAAEEKAEGSEEAGETEEEGDDTD